MELQTFYLTVAIILLAIAILAAPTLWKRSHKGSSKTVEHRVRK